MLRLISSQTIMDPTPEIQELDKEIIKAQFQAWMKELKIKGEKFSNGSQSLELAFDRSDDPESKFNEETVLLQQPRPEELPEIPRINGEQWLGITIVPKNPYNSRVGLMKGVHSIGLSPSLKGDAAEALIVFLSNSGRDYQKTVWRPIRRQSLREEPERRETLDFATFNQELEPLQPLSGQTLERLNFLYNLAFRGSTT